MAESYLGVAVSDLRFEGEVVIKAQSLACRCVEDLLRRTTAMCQKRLFADRKRCIVVVLQQQERMALAGRQCFLQQQKPVFGLKQRSPGATTTIITTKYEFQPIRLK